jgi:hypothetical protein
MIGGVTLPNGRRGLEQAGTIGYWVGEPQAHRGYMTTALRVLLPTLFGELNLHRIEAACIPSNASSIRVLEKCGFSREGLARRYLCINGVWQDHLLFGLLHEDFRGYAVSQMTPSMPMSMQLWMPWVRRLCAAITRAQGCDAEMTRDFAWMTKL